MSAREAHVASSRIVRCSLVAKKAEAARVDLMIIAISLFTVGGWYVADVETSWIASFIMPPLIAVILLEQLFLYWWVEFNVKVCYSAQDLDHATHVAVYPAEHCGQAEICRLETRDEFRYFVYQQQKYFGTARNSGATLQGFDLKAKASEEKQQSASKQGVHTFARLEVPICEKAAFYRTTQGLSQELVAHAAPLYGMNEFNVPMPEFMELFKEHAMAPFFVFQMFCVLLWCLDEYWYYSIFTGVMLILVETLTIKRRQKDMKQLRAIRVPSYEVQVYRDGGWTTCQSNELLPGDMVSIHAQADGLISSCDMLLLSGSVVVNEAMLTGESVPQLKDCIDELGDDVHLNVEGDHKRNIIFSGTNVLLHTGQSNKQSKLKVKSPPNGGAVGFVLRTGFDTAQGQLMQTILFSTSRVTAGNTDSLYFILFLLVFALAASGYVLVVGLADPSRDKWKLMLNCTMIITSVIPPELPMQLTLAVQNSLKELLADKIFCTEPFRIPFAGAVSHICFDKTGTLTEDVFTVQGISDVGADPKQFTFSTVDELETTLKPVLSASIMARHVIAGCHSLITVHSRIIGDPLEKAAFDTLGWELGTDSVARGTGGEKVGIVKRYPFSSALKRMSTVVRVNEKELCLVSKGAAETLEALFDPDTLPACYEAMHRTFAREGGRVLALGYRKLGIDNVATKSQVDKASRESIEQNLTFVGFLVLRCPVKENVDQVITELIESSHRVVMITGDHLLTACHVAREVKMCSKPLLQLMPHDEHGFAWESSVEEVADSKVTIHPFNVKTLPTLAQTHQFVVAGDDLTLLMESAISTQDLNSLIRYIDVFARASPAQKEFVLLKLKELGEVTMMCGDGTNDVGALRQAHVGVALLGEAGDLQKKKAKKKAQNRRRANLDDDLGGPGPVQFGDASIASPFTSRLPHPSCTARVIRQGRSTLVTTRQMYMILAVNSLVSAYSMSVLYLRGVKYGDTQMTVLSLGIAFMFMFLAWSKPLETLSKERPGDKLFHPLMFVNLLGQFAIHMYCLLNVVAMTDPFVPKDEDALDIDGDFEPNVFNSVVFLMMSCATLTTFICNYRGLPFKVSLKNNKGLYRLVVLANVSLYIFAGGFSDDLNELMELVPMPSDEFTTSLLGYMLLDQLGTFAFTRVMHKLKA